MNLKSLSLLSLSSLLSLGALRLPAQGAEVRGRISDARNASPIAYARVEVIGRADVAQSDLAGVFVLRGIEPGSYALRIRAIGYAVRQVSIDVANTRITSADVALEPSTLTLGAVHVDAARQAGSTTSTTFDRHAIEASARRDIGELLERVPGVVVTQAGGPGAPSRASIRGSGANQVLVLVDGVAINSELSGAADLSLISLESVERVTVHTGAQSARYGPRAMAGVIDIETRHAAREASALIRQGAWGEQGYAVTAGDTRAVGAKQLSGSVTGDYRSVVGDFEYEKPVFRGGGTAQRINAGSVARNILGRASIDGANGSLGVRGALQNLDRGMAGTIVQPSASGHQDQTRATGGIDAHWQRSRFSWTGAADYSHERARFADPTPPFSAPLDDTTTVSGITANTNITFAGAARSASIGADVRTLHITASSLAPGAPTHQNITGLWTTLRATHASGNTLLDADVAARADQTSLAHGTTFSPRATGRVARGVFTGSVSVGSGYAPPTLADQFFREGVQVRANPALRPERTHHDTDVRLGVRGVHAGALNIAADISAFRADIDGMILWQPNFQFVWMPANYDVHRAGWETSARIAHAGTHLELGGNVNRSDVTYAGPVLTGQVAYRPRTTANAQITFTPRRARIAVSTRYVGARRTVSSSALNMLDPYWLTDARISTSIVRRGVGADITLSIDNVFDQSVAMLVDYPFPPRAWSVAVRLRHQ